jgi:glucokinase
MGTPAPSRKAIIVNGPPASGKSTIAREMARVFNLPILARDTIQETLYDVIGIGDREYNRMLGRAGMAVIWEVIANFPMDASVIIDTWCRYPPYDWVRQGLSTAGIDRFVEIWCHAPDEVLSARYLSRVGERHPGHPGKEFAVELKEIAKKAGPMGIGVVFRVDTSSPELVDIPKITSWVSAKLKIKPIEQKRP